MGRRKWETSLQSDTLSFTFWSHQVWAPSFPAPIFVSAILFLPMGHDGTTLNYLCVESQRTRPRFSRSSRCLNTLFSSPAVCFAITSHLQPPWRLLLLVLLFTAPSGIFYGWEKEQLIGYRIKRIKQGAPRTKKVALVPRKVYRPNSRNL